MATAPIIITPKTDPVATVLLLHGLGADGNDLVSFAHELITSTNLPLKFILPTAPTIPITISYNMPMPAWFNITALNKHGVNEDPQMLQASQQTINKLIDTEINNGIAAQKIIVAGFSQGAAMALQCGLRYPQPLGGILSLSGFIVDANKIANERHPANNKIPILMLHGTSDQVVLFDWAKLAYDKLVELNYNVSLKKYPIEHCICDNEINDAAAWIRDK